MKNLKNATVFFTTLGVPTTLKMSLNASKWSLTWPKIAPRWPSWNQDGEVRAKIEPTWPQVGAKMAKLEPRWSQHGPKE